MRTTAHIHPATIYLGLHRLTFAELELAERCLAPSSPAPGDTGMSIVLLRKHCARCSGSFAVPWGA